MKPPRWAFALVVLGSVGALGGALVIPSSARADAPPDNSAPADARYNMSARGDAFYFELDGDDIPVNRANSAGSLTAEMDTTSTGGSKGFAAAPYYGESLGKIPGPINGVMDQFNASQFHLPFSELPGYIQASSTSETKKEEDGQYYRASVEALPTSGKSSAFYGPPPSSGAPNQMQTATATTQSIGSAVVATAQGSSEGLVDGPLEIGSATALATITQATGQEPKVESKSFGRFSVNGQAFGFDQNGFQYLGQGASSADAFAQANSALKAANIQLDLVPMEKSKSPSGGTIFTIGGLSVTTVQQSPSGSGPITFKYVIGRASVSSDNVTFGSSVNSASTSAGTQPAAHVESTNPSGSVQPASITSSKPAGSAASNSSAGGGLDASAPVDLAGQAAQAPTQVSTGSDTVSIAPAAQALPAQAALPPAAGVLPRTLGYVPAAQTRGTDSILLFTVLALAGVGLLGGPVLFNRFAAAVKG